jgi:N-acetylglutamate synthase-like GNAT family acetyltransferase
LVEIIYRPARIDEKDDIRRLVYSSRINPFGLDWKRFLVATTGEGEIIGCVQIKSHYDGTSELASLAVYPGWRSKGIARSLITRLLDGAPRPLYLTCRSGLLDFYQKFGFQVLNSDELHPYFHRLKCLADLFFSSTRHESLLVMSRKH